VSIVCIFWWQLRQSHPPLVILSHRLTTYGYRAFSVAGPMFWNSLAQTPAWPVTYWCCFFGRLLKKKFFLRVTSVHSALATMPYINWCFTYLLTYLHCNPYETAKLPQFPHTVSPRTTICDSSWYSNRIVIEFKSNINRIAYIRITACTYLPSGLRRFGPVERKDDTDCIKRCMPLSWMN